jgi:hypothetical protein
MGNIMHLKLEHPIEDVEVRITLEEILTSRFGRSFAVSEGPCWRIGFSQDIQEQLEDWMGRSHFGYEICREDSRTLTYKVQTQPFTDFLSKYVEQHMAARLNAQIVDYDGSGEVWDPHPGDFKTYRAFLNYIYSPDNYPYLSEQKAKNLSDRRIQSRLEATPPVLQELGDRDR